MNMPFGIELLSVVWDEVEETANRSAQRAENVKLSRELLPPLISPASNGLGKERAPAFAYVIPQWFPSSKQTVARCSCNFLFPAT